MKKYTFKVKQFIFYEINANCEKDAREELCNNFELTPSEDCILDDDYKKADCIDIEETKE